jgi:hypothetical protein
VINPTTAQQQLDLSIEVVAFAGSGRRWHMSPLDIYATIVIGRKPGVEVAEQMLGAVPGTVTLAAWSVSIYEFR